MENARLLDEMRERTGDLQETLEYQTATSDVLKVISQSTFDLDPVLGNVVETALRLCRAHMGSIYPPRGWGLPLGGRVAVSNRRIEEIEMQTPILPGAETLVGRAALNGRAVQIADVEADPTLCREG